MRTVLLLIALSMTLAAVVLRQGPRPAPSAAATAAAPDPGRTAADPEADPAPATGRLWSWRSADGVRHLSTNPPPAGTPAIVTTFGRAPDADADTTGTAPPGAPDPDVDAALRGAAGAAAAARLLREGQQALDALRNGAPAR